MTADEDLQNKLLQALRQLMEVTAQNERLRAEVVSLKGKLNIREGNVAILVAESKESYLVAGKQSQVKNTSASEKGVALTKEKKIKLFRSLFRGREDIYPLRWENVRTGKSGYSPAIRNKWEYLEAKKQGNKNIQADYLPLNDEVIQQHLEGKIVAGLYPLLKDDTCWCLAVDFDEKDYRADSLSFLRTCQELGIDAYPERSRSGNGAHIWIFFEAAISAMLARQLGFLILTKTLEKRHQIALKSYDRLFPNQDTLPRGGFGNLIALPLQREAREKGGSVFLDNEFNPVSDQWYFLSAIKRVGADLIEKLTATARREGDIIHIATPAFDEADTDDPWTLPPSKRKTEKQVVGPFPESIEIVRSNLVYIDKTALSSSLINRLKLPAAFQNPEFFRNQAMRLPTYDKPRIIDCSEDTGKYLALPRGCLEEAETILKSYGIKVKIVDHRFLGNKITARFAGTLRGSQKRSVEQLQKSDMALFCAPTAYGKTVVAAAVIAERGINTLVLVHRQQLIEQWRERLQSFLGNTGKDIGQMGAGRKALTGNIDVAMIQSLVRGGEVNDLVANYGQVIIDECHHVSAFSFEQVLRGCKAKYVLGLTATPRRKDGHHPIIVMQCGALIKAGSEPEGEALMRKRCMLARKTGLVLPVSTEKPSMHELYQMLTGNFERNNMIVADIKQAIQEGRCPLVLTERIEHLDILAKMLEQVAVEKIILKGGMGKKQRLAAMKQIQSAASARIILATGRYIGEGFDDSRLDTLFLALPISWTGTLQQYVGRLHRLHVGKKDLLVYDYVDSQIPTLQRMYRKRLRGYKALGYELKE